MTALQIKMILLTIIPEHPLTVVGAMSATSFKAIGELVLPADVHVVQYVSLALSCDHVAYPYL